jgi:hypothetical protein
MPLHSRIKKCPTCGSTAICRSRRRGFKEKFLHILRIVPFRCDDCSIRFFQTEF